MFRKMLIANDGSKGGDHALAFAIDLARRLDLALHMVCVEELPWFPGERRRGHRAERRATSGFSMA